MIVNKALITVADLRTYATISNNLDIHWINGYIERVQLQYIVPCIGRPLFDEILLQYNSNTLTPLNVDLLDNYLKRVIGWYTYLESYSAMLFRPENKAPSINTDDKSVAISPNIISYYKTDIKNNADIFMAELKRFLDENHTFYPLYPYNNPNCETNSNCSEGTRSWGLGG